jgi:hypothetical protein
MVVPSRCLKSLEDRRNWSRFHAMKAAIRHPRLSSSIPKADFSGRLLLKSGGKRVTKCSRKMLQYLQLHIET